MLDSRRPPQRRGTRAAERARPSHSADGGAADPTPPRCWRVAAESSRLARTARAQCRPGRGRTEPAWPLPRRRRHERVPPCPAQIHAVAERSTLLLLSTSGSSASSTAASRSREALTAQCVMAAPAELASPISRHTTVRESLSPCRAPRATGDNELAHAWRHTSLLAI